MGRSHAFSTILVIGSGPIVIGQACEFDYSGTQACQALKSEGYRVVLVNSNPATMMTDPAISDATYLEPITTETLTRIIVQENIEALLPTMGGQTALNITMELHRQGILEREHVQVIGARVDAIEKAENRAMFQKICHSIGLETPPGSTVSSLEEGWKAVQKLGFPVVLRPSFTLGGKGGSLVRSQEQFEHDLNGALHASPLKQVLVEKSVLGWKEYEMEVVRDRNDNAIIVCAIENVDPMGIHTGDSITVAPTMTLSDKEYQIMRTASIDVLRAIGVETGGANVQFALHPESGQQMVIEMNPRVSRSSALASKATGFPIARVATLLAVGYTLDELRNEITKRTPASFEPTLDYVVTKIPRFSFEKFPDTSGHLGTVMQSVGEVMALGATFCQSLQKAIASLEEDRAGVASLSQKALSPKDTLIRLKEGSPQRLFLILQAMRQNIPLKDIQEASQYDFWFLHQIQRLVDEEKHIKKHALPLDVHGIRRLKILGFSDRHLALLGGVSVEEFRQKRWSLNVRPTFRRVDTCAGEFASSTPYLYSTYEKFTLRIGESKPLEVCESQPSNKRKVMILGSGPNRIGQGIEFDYCCCHAALALRKAGIESVMVNCNPETVSTDYDTADRLYCEPLEEEYVLEVAFREKEKGTLEGVIVQMGGQTPLKLAYVLEKAGYSLLGTTAEAIMQAEDRERFSQMVEPLGLMMPSHGVAHNEEEFQAVAESIGYPILVRPSHVLGGRAMSIFSNPDIDPTEISTLFQISHGPVQVDRYLEEAIEVDVDALCDGKNVWMCGMMEHVEIAGIHSGDSACVLPPRSFSTAMMRMLEDQTVLLARAMGNKGLLNVQFAIQGENIFLLEANPRASRTVPFLAKVTGFPIIETAVALMLGTPAEETALKGKSRRLWKQSPIAVKEAVLPFARFQKTDPLLGPEMRSTGEVIGIDKTFPLAFAKSQVAAGFPPPSSGCAFFSVKEADKKRFLPLAQKLSAIGFSLKATDGTAMFFRNNALKVETINKVVKGSPHCVDAMNEGQIHVVFNTTQGYQSLKDSTSLRQAAVLNAIPYYTTYHGAKAIVKGMEEMKQTPFSYRPLQDIIKDAMEA